MSPDISVVALLEIIHSHVHLLKQCSSLHRKTNSHPGICSESGAIPVQVGWESPEPYSGNLLACSSLVPYGPRHLK